MSQKIALIIAWRNLGLTLIGLGVCSLTLAGLQYWLYIAFLNIRFRIGPF